MKALYHVINAGFPVRTDAFQHSSCGSQTLTRVIWLSLQTVLSRLPHFIYFGSGFHRATESQRSSSSTPCSNLELVAQDNACLGFEYFHGWRLHNLSEPPVPVFDHTHIKKNLFLKFKHNCLYFNLCLFRLILSLDTTQKSLTLLFVIMSYVML